MNKKSRKKPKGRNKNLLLVAKFTVYSYAYVRQVACGDRKNETIERAIEAANRNNLETLIKIKQERDEELKLNLQITG